MRGGARSLTPMPTDLPDLWCEVKDISPECTWRERSSPIRVGTSSLVAVSIEEQDQTSEGQ